MEFCHFHGVHWQDRDTSLLAKWTSHSVGAFKADVGRAGREKRCVLLSENNKQSVGQRSCSALCLFLVMFLWLQDVGGAWSTEAPAHTCCQSASLIFSPTSFSEVHSLTHFSRPINENISFIKKKTILNFFSSLLVSSKFEFPYSGL